MTPLAGTTDPDMFPHHSPNRVFYSKHVGLGVSANRVHGFERFILQNYFFLPCMGRKQQRYVKFHSFLEGAVISISYNVTGYCNACAK